MVVVVGHTSVTTPPPSVVTAGVTQWLSTKLWGEPPSGHVPALVSATENLIVDFGMQTTLSTGSPFVAAFA